MFMPQELHQFDRRNKVTVKAVDSTVTRDSMLQVTTASSSDSNYW
jgi:hypothetical protein